MLSYAAFENGLWPFAFIVLAGVLPTALWRWIGVGLVSGIEENSAIFVLVRCMAAGFVAVVIAQFVFSPTGALAQLPLAWRLSAMVIGFAAFLVGGRRIAVGILVGELALLAGWLFT